jgi:hypothetical protein
MTLGIIWLRVVGSTRELLVTSDSRLGGGQSWDGNPKILLLPRSDSVLSFSGKTDDAYPLMIQAWNAINMHGPSRDRSLNLADLKGHLVRVFNHSRTFIHSLPFNQTRPDNPEAIFSLSGYSWKTKKFHIWKLHYDNNISSFTFQPTPKWRGQDKKSEKMIAYLGDEDAINYAKEKLVIELRKSNKLISGNFDMEPFIVLRDIIRERKFNSVGGPIQMVKIYEHSNAVPFGIFWPDKKNGQISVLGRPLLSYEKNSWGALDPDNPTKTISSPKPAG